MEEEIPAGADLLKEKHVKFFARCLATIPQDHENLDSVRVTLALFALSGLDLLGALHKAYKDEEERQKVIDWVYSFQVLPDKDNPSSNLKQCGFLGSSSNGSSFNPSDVRQPMCSIPRHQEYIIYKSSNSVQPPLILADQQADIKFYGHVDEGCVARVVLAFFARK